MKALGIVAHFDDVEFTACGTFALWQRKLGDEFQGRVVVCTDGAAGHHFRTREETARMRLAEQQAAARVGGYEFQQLRLPDGRIGREGLLQEEHGLLPALWHAIREFEPDYLLCPPLPRDPLVGLHADHVAVAEAVRRVAYLINVPHAFTPEYPANESLSQPCRVPVILNLYDGYLFGANTADLAIDVEEVFAQVSAASWCHQSQIREWLPWVGRHNIDAPATPEEWSEILRARFLRQNREMGISSEHTFDVFTVTAWGTVPTVGQLLSDLPNVSVASSDLAALRHRLSTWHGDAE